MQEPKAVPEAAGPIEIPKESEELYVTCNDIYSMHNCHIDAPCMCCFQELQAAPGVDVPTEIPKESEELAVLCMHDACVFVI